MRDVERLPDPAGSYRGASRSHALRSPARTAPIGSFAVSERQAVGAEEADVSGPRENGVRWRCQTTHAANPFWPHLQVPIGWQALRPVRGWALTFAPLKDKYLVWLGKNYCRGIHPCAAYSHLLVRKMRHDLCLNLAHVFRVGFTYRQVKYRAYLNI